MLMLATWEGDLLTYSMVQSPFWAANQFAASQEFPRISRNPKVHYRTHKRPPPVSILGPPSPVHIPTSHLLEIHPNIIHPSMSRSPQWSLSLHFPHQDPIYPPLLTHTRHMPSPSHSSRDYADKFFSCVTTSATRCLMRLNTIDGSPSGLQDLALIGYVAAVLTALLTHSFSIPMCETACVSEITEYV